MATATKKKPTTNTRKLTAYEKEIVANGRAVINEIRSRTAMLRSLLDDDRRDLAVECGWPANISIEDYKTMYGRLGIAARVVDIFADECWKESPKIYETEDAEITTEFEAAWEALDKQHQLIDRMHRADQISGIGRFGIILLGIADGKTLDKPIDGIDDYGNPTGEQATAEGTSTTKETNDGIPVAKASFAKREFLYARCFDESLVRIENSDWNRDTKSPRFGLPNTYTIIMGDAETGNTKDTKVHWTRVLHLADNRKDSENYGIPRMQQVFNHLLDIRKVAGSSAEMFYKGGFPGIAAIADAELVAAGADFDAVEMRKELEAYQNTLQRVLAFKGADVKTLATNIADPKNTLEMLILLICITLGVPLRTFMGSEQGKLAADQDSKNWSKRVAGRQHNYCTPIIIQPLVQRLIAAGCLPVPSEFIVDWPDMESPTDAEKAEVASKMSEAMSRYVTGGGVMLMDEIHFLTLILKFSPEEAASAVKSIKALEELEKKLLMGAGLGGGNANEEDDKDDNGDTKTKKDTNSEEKKVPSNGRRPAGRTSGSAR
jgi:hypothetical protein